MARVPIFLFSSFLLCIAIFLFYFPVNALSGESPLNSFLDQVEEKAADVRSFTCDFRQERHLSIFPKPVVFSGHLSLERPDRLRWEFVKPIPSALILNGRSGTRCEPKGGKQVFSLDTDPVMRIVARQLWSWTGGTYRDLAGDFDMQLAGLSVLVLSPVKKGAGNFISKITVRFDPDTLQPVQVIIAEPGDDRTVLFFDNYQTNIKLPDASFTDCLIMPADDRRN